MKLARLAAILVVPALLALTGGIVACGGDTDGTGEIVEDAEIEARIADVMESEFGREHEVNCPDDGIEVGTDFTCIATPAGIEGAEARIETHLDSDGETIEPFDPEPYLTE